MEKNIFIYANDTQMSKTIEKTLRSKLDDSGLRVCDKLDGETRLIICIGGDGTLLHLVQDFAFPSVPIVGINTGHLGFFQEILPERIDDLIFMFNQGSYSIQKLFGVSAKVRTKENESTLNALNEIALKGLLTHPIHLNIALNDSFIERFSGDGIIVSTPAGSTAYNYSLGGSIIDPRIDALQVTPIAPMQSVAYRSFTSGILIPSNDNISVIPCSDEDTTMSLVYDGFITEYKDVEQVTFSKSDKSINLVRFDNYQFWEKVKSKFL